MKWEVEMELEDVYGGDGEIRLEPKERTIQKKTRTKTTVREGWVYRTSPDITEEEIKEKKQEPILTFRFDDNGNPVLRLGGSHGKLWGALKDSGKQLYHLQDPDFKRSYKTAVEMIYVSPVWVPLETEDDFKLEGIPQVLQGPGAKQIIQQFDVIPQATIKVVLSFPDKLEPHAEKLLSQLEIGSHFNKRRTTIKIKSKKVVS